MSRPLPLPVRVAAGLAANAAESARRLPRTLVGLPVTVASHAMQASMRVQQEITELAIKGDDALSAFQPADEQPEWATFDEDLPFGEDRRPYAPASAWDAAGATGADPWHAEERALAAEHPPGEYDTAPGTGVPAVCPEYPDLSLPQLRARLRRFSLDDLRELLDYERSHRARPDFTGMLTRRIDTVRGTA